MRKSKVKPVEEVLRVPIPQFITHVKKSKTKFVKISGQKIYSGMSPHLRSSIVHQMHEYLKPFILKELGNKSLKNLLPLEIRLEVYVPINYGTVRMYKGEVRWKKPAADYSPTWDADNLWIWGKCFNDTLVSLGIIEDDNVGIIKDSGSIKFFPIKEFDKRKLVFVIKKSKQ